MTGHRGVTSLLTATLAFVTHACAPSVSQRGVRSADLVGVTPADQTPLTLTLDRMDGHPVDVVQLRGRAVLIIAFLMDDLSSQGELRHAERIAHELGDDIAVLAISGSRDPYRTHREMLQIFARVNELQQTQLLLADDSVREGSTALGSIDAVPTTYLVNRAGVIARRVTGYLDYTQLRDLIAPAIPPRH